MTKICEETEKHKELHKALDELLACWIDHNKGLLGELTVMALLTWSHEQTKETTSND